MEWKFSWLAAWVMLSLLLSEGDGVDGFIGMQWGRYSSQSLVPSMVVDLLMQNGMNEIRLSAPSPNVMEALQSSGLGVTVALQNDFIKRMKWVKNLQSIDDWIRELLLEPVKRGVQIKTLVIIEQPFTLNRGPIWNVIDIFNETLSCMEKYNLTHIKPTTSHFTDVLKNVSKPSEADFRDDVKDKMIDFLKILKERNSFFLYDLHPIFSARVNDWPIEFAFMDNRSNFTVVDGEYVYRNAFDFMFDALVVALEKAGHKDMEIVVGEVGWPTDGEKHATPKNAERFYRGFLKYIKEKKGTPRRKNKNIDVYLSELTDENKVVELMGPISRHRGIYNFDGTPKFKIDFTGKDRDIYPTVAQGTVKMPSRWCIFNGLTDDDMAKADKIVEDVCKVTDCSALSPDSTCSNLNHTWKVSYVFNMYYQALNQDMDQQACIFGGLGSLTPFDPSVGDCEFPVEILTAERVDGGIQVLNYVGYASSGDRLKCYTTQLLPIIGLMLLLQKQIGFLV